MKRVQYNLHIGTIIKYQDILKNKVNICLVIQSSEIENVEILYLYVYFTFFDIFTYYFCININHILSMCVLFTYLIFIHNA